MSGCAGWGLAPLASSDEGIAMWSADAGGRMEYVVPTAPPMYDVKCSDVQELPSSLPWPAITPGCQPFAGTRSAAVAATRPQGQFSSLQSAPHWDPHQQQLQQHMLYQEQQLMHQQAPIPGFQQQQQQHEQRPRPYQLPTSCHVALAAAPGAEHMWQQQQLQHR